MDSYLKSDVFFFITAIAVVLLSILFGVVLIYSIRILSDAKEISKKITEQVQFLNEDLNTARAKVKQAGWGGIYKVISGIFLNRKGRRK